MKIESTNFLAIFKHLVIHRSLIWQLTKRDILSRYKGSFLGMFWAVFNPLIMLTVYTFVFSVVFQARWGLEVEERGGFAMVLFAGLIVFNFFAECISRAPGLIVTNVNYVKRVVFPLDVLAWVVLGSALFNAFISLGILLVAIVFFTHGFPVGVIFLPLLFLPLSFFLLGLVWFLSSLGVFVRDTLQAVNILVTLLMFLSPIFYPLSAVPESFRPFLQINPLVFIIAQFRNVLIFGRLPDWSGLLIYYVFSLGVMYLGWIWFLKTRKGFADVL